ncbi:MAG: chromate transporter [Candidatus Cloacimonetes bacterium]|jgi:chromate transporter|nr:chromate transporter [Candidatus Cloacimonadota bacterium]MDY0337699.1 chromate transporter [Candidatus Cloacimonadaceae bacterium]MCB5269125.1 chromate transporter [Candidatus Cloacimonadota bacterium]MCK9333745.1 chromate transporter [Candidatus Cloacimonadota bacterium]MDD2544512.1 chromate transporter [Candidatus Cloacimonadota bacterium]
MLLQIFLSFLKIGAFTIGGAYAMIPLIKKEVCETRAWISEDDFLNGLAAAQSCPGPIAVNISIYTGYHVKGYPGMLMAVLGSILPSTISIILIAMLFNQYADQILVRKAFSALRPAVVALIAVPLIQMAQKSGLNQKNAWFPFVIAILVGTLNISPVYLILLTIVFAVWESHR